MMIDIAIDFMDMTNDRHVWACPSDARSGLHVATGRYVVVGDDDADAAVALVIAVDAAGNIELEVLPGSVESHRDLLTLA